MASLTLNQSERRELISALVTNCAGWDAEDIELLVNMSDEKIWAHAQGCAHLIANASGEEIESTGNMPDSLEPSSSDELNSSTEDADDEQEVGDGDVGEKGTDVEQDEEKDQPKKCWDEDGNETSCPEGKADGENVTENEWLSYAPPRIRSVVINAMKFEQAQKKQLVATITANSRNRMSAGFLMTKGLDELEALADLAAPRRNNAVYVGAAGGPVLNQANVDREDILTVPVLNFERE
jgi:hypothetical protein